eukprot:scaffold437_cov168-Ochromonas_danica.AAC.55
MSAIIVLRARDSTDVNLTDVNLTDLYLTDVNLTDHPHGQHGEVLLSLGDEAHHLLQLAVRAVCLQKSGGSARSEERLVCRGVEQLRLSAQACEALGLERLLHELCAGRGARLRVSREAQQPSLIPRELLREMRRDLDEVRAASRA